MRRSIHPLPHTSSWRNAEIIKHRDNFTVFFLPSVNYTWVRNKVSNDTVLELRNILITIFTISVSLTPPRRKLLINVVPANIVNPFCEYFCPQLGHHLLSRRIERTCLSFTVTPRQMDFHYHPQAALPVARSVSPYPAQKPQADCPKEPPLNAPQANVGSLANRRFFSTRI
jgi:hypothetical protein